MVEPDEEQVETTVDSTPVIEQRGFNIALLFKRLTGTFSLAVGPNQEYERRYDDSDGSLVGVDANGEEMYRAAKSRGVFSFSRMPQVPEYDAKSDVPSPDPDGPYAGEPADPRGIVRFTANAGVPTPGLYSYSVAEGQFVRLDKP